VPFLGDEAADKTEILRLASAPSLSIDDRFSKLVGVPRAFGGHLLGSLRRDEMQDERRYNARPNRQSCALAQIPPKTGGNQHQSSQRS
jgi:hypothetical protein